MGCGFRVEAWKAMCFFFKLIGEPHSLCEMNMEPQKGPTKTTVLQKGAVGEFHINVDP